MEIGDFAADAALFARMRTMWEQVDPEPADLVDRMVAAVAVEDLSREYALLTLVEGSTLAAVRTGMRRYSEAEEGFRRSVAIYDAMDPNHPDLVPCLEDFARLCDQLGRSAEAAKLRARAAKIRTVVAGPKTTSPEAAGK